MSDITFSLNWEPSGGHLQVPRLHFEHEPVPPRLAARRAGAESLQQLRGLPARRFTSSTVRTPVTRGHGLWASHPSAEAGGASGGRAVQEHCLPPLPAWTPPTWEVSFSLQ